MTVDMSAMLISCKHSRQSRTHLSTLPVQLPPAARAVWDHDMDMRTKRQKQDMQQGM